MRDFIPQIEPWIDNSELKELKRVIDSTFITENKLTKEFEDMIIQHKNKIIEHQKESESAVGQEQKSIIDKAYQHFQKRPTQQL